MLSSSTPILDASAPTSGTSIPGLAAAMRIAYDFASGLADAGFTPTSILIEISGSLAFAGYGSPIASGLILGLTGYQPEQLDFDNIPALLETIRSSKTLRLNGKIAVPFIESEHLILSPSGLLPGHPDGVRLTAYHCMHPFVSQQYYSPALPGQTLDSVCFNASTLYRAEC